MAPPWWWGWPGLGNSPLGRDRILVVVQAQFMSRLQNFKVSVPRKPTLTDSRFTAAQDPSYYQKNAVLGDFRFVIGN